MKLAALFAVVLVAAPAFAQRAQQTPNTPPPEGFYNGIPNAYDLLARPEALSNVNRIARPFPDCPANLDGADTAVVLADPGNADRPSVTEFARSLVPGKLVVFRTPDGKPMLCRFVSGDAPASAGQ
jgi:hypothetical protein